MLEPKLVFARKNNSTYVWLENGLVIGWMHHRFCFIQRNTYKQQNIAKLSAAISVNSL